MTEKYKLFGAAFAVKEDIRFLNLSKRVAMLVNISSFISRVFIVHYGEKMFYNELHINIRVCVKEIFYVIIIETERGNIFPKPISKFLESNNIRANNKIMGLVTNFYID